MSFFSVLIPCRNEEKNIRATIESIEHELDAKHIHYEILVVNDGSTDNTEQVLLEIIKRDKKVRVVNNTSPHGIGNAIKKGLEAYQGDSVIIAMADASDDPKDMIKYIQEMENNQLDCCFGSRWIKGARVEGYPVHKLILNRLANWFIKILFQIPYNDVTNAFKCYSRNAIEGIKPILSHHFNVTVEMPLKVIVRGYSYKVVPTHWRQRKVGISSLKIKEMGSRYLFIVLYLWLEKLLAKGDYSKK